MPVYQYACRDCSYQFEKRQGFHDDPLRICPECHGAVQRVISPVGIIFKGSGFYINDSKKGRNGSNGSGSKLKTDSTGSSAKSSDSKSKDSESKKESTTTKTAAPD